MHYWVLVDLYQIIACLLSIEPCIARPTFIDLSPIKLNYYSFMISLDKFNRSCDDIDDLATKIRNKRHKCLSS